MSPSQRNGSKNNLTNRMPRSTERVILARVANTDTDTAVGGHDLKNDIKGRKRDRLCSEVVCLCDCDEKDG